MNPFSSGMTLFLIYWMRSGSMAEREEVSLELAGLNPPVSALDPCVPPVILKIIARI